MPECLDMLAPLLDLVHQVFDGPIIQVTTYGTQARCRWRRTHENDKRRIQGYHINHFRYISSFLLTVARKRLLLLADSLDFQAIMGVATLILYFHPLCSLQQYSWLESLSYLSICLLGYTYSSLFASPHPQFRMDRIIINLTQMVIFGLCLSNRPCPFISYDQQNMFIDYKGFISMKHSKPTLTLLLLLALLASGAQACGIDEYQSGGSCLLCTVISPACQQCNDGNACSVCQVGYAGVYCSGCAPGYSPWAGSCNSCASISPRCLECADSNTCTVCETPYGGIFCDTCATGYVGANCDACAVGYFMNNWSCTSCTMVYANCGECSDSATCNACAVGYFMDNGSCTSCTMVYANCGECSDSATCNACTAGYGNYDCSQCATGWYPIASDPILCSSCEADISPGCLACMSSTDCLACKIGFVGTLCNQCATGYTGPTCSTCEDGYYQGATAQCLTCPFSCLTCSGPNTCTACPNGKSITSNCQDCAPGLYMSEGSCQACLAVCATCSDATSCTACQLGLSPPTCQGCQAGYVLVATSCTACSILIASCIECTSASFCTTCETGKLASATGDTCTSCRQSMANCSECTSANACTACDSGYYLDASGTLCMSCSQSGPGCTSCTSAIFCTACQAGYYLNSVTRTCQLCSSTMVHCQSCTSAATCSGCQAGYILDATQPSCALCSTLIANCSTCATSASCSTCMTGFYSGGASCVPCTTTLSHCLTCGSSFHCYTCETGYAPVANGTCVACINLMTNCGQCSSFTVCTACADGTNNCNLTILVNTNGPSVVGEASNISVGAIAGGAAGGLVAIVAIFFLAKKIIALNKVANTPQPTFDAPIQPNQMQGEVIQPNEMPLNESNELKANEEVQPNETRVEEMAETYQNNQSFSQLDPQSSPTMNRTSNRFSSIKAPESTRRDFLQINETTPQESFE